MEILLTVNRPPLRNRSFPFPVSAHLLNLFIGRGLATQLQRIRQTVPPLHPSTPQRPLLY